MPLSALVRLLQTRSLHVARSDHFEDKLEGMFGFNLIEKHVKAPTDLVARAVGILKTDCFLSCWHLSDSESLAMWRLYGRGDAPIAIVSSVSAVMSDSNVFCETTDFGGMFGDVIYDSFFLDGRFRAS